jgi:PAS domain S-box-containing protein
MGVTEHDTAVRAPDDPGASARPPDERLGEAEERLRLALEATQLGTWDYLPHADVLHWDARARAIFGVAPEGEVRYVADFLGRLHPEDRGPVQAVVAQALDARGSGAYDAEFRVVLPDGAVRWVRARGRALFDDAGPARRAARFIGTVLDVTAERDAVAERGRLLSESDAARHAAEAARREAEAARERLARVFAETPAAVGILAGPDHVVQSVNEMFLRVLGRRDYVGRPAREGAPELAEQGFLALLDAVYRTGEPHVGREARLVWDRDGAGAPAEGVFNFVYQPLAGPTGEVEGILVFAVEVTDSVRARRAVEELNAQLRERALELEAANERLRAATATLAERTAVAEHEERRARSVLESISDAFFALDRGWRFTYLNDRAEEVLQRRREELLGRTLWTEFAPALGTTFEREYRRAMDGGEPVAFEEWYAPLATWFEVRAYPGPDGLAVYFQDVSARKAAEAVVADHLLAEQMARAEAEAAREEAERARRAADAANAAKSAFLATMSHELRTPLNAQIGYAQLLELGLAGPLTPAQREYVGRLTTSSHHLLGLINDVLDLAKIESGETHVARAPAATGAAVRTAFDLTLPQAAARGLRLENALDGRDGEAYVGDEHRVRQILVNLLSNAVKFTDPGGTVRVSSGAAAEAPALAGALRGAGPWAWVRVDDTGVGVPPDEQARIFEPFHQVNARHTRTAGGTGLGLAISRRLARLMGGDLTVESTPGAGSRFTLWLPGVAGARGAEAAERDAPTGRDAAAVGALRLADLGQELRAATDEILEAYADRLRADPALPPARAMRRSQLEDHMVTFLADLAQSLVLVSDAGVAAVEYLRDGGAIQRAVAEAHGARRRAQGWSEAQLRRDQEILREQLERALRARLRPDGAEAEQALGVLLSLVDRAAAASVRAWRRAAEADAAEGGSAPAPGPASRG